MKNKKPFQELIQSDTPTLVDFYAEWCGPCKAMQPILQEVAKTMGDAVSIIKVDIDRNQALATRLNIRGVPTFVIYRNGEIQWRQSGMQSAHALIDAVQQAMTH